MGVVYYFHLRIVTGLNITDAMAKNKDQKGLWMSERSSSGETADTEKHKSLSMEAALQDHFLCRPGRNLFRQQCLHTDICHTSNPPVETTLE